MARNRLQLRRSGRACEQLERGPVATGRCQCGNRIVSRYTYDPMDGVNIPNSMQTLDTTLRPTRDKAIAHDGVLVVLHADQTEAVTLHYAKGAWNFLRHRARGASDARDTATWCWRGTRYPLVGHVITTLTAADPLRAWTDWYDTLLAVRNDPAEQQDQPFVAFA